MRKPKAYDILRFDIIELARGIVLEHGVVSRNMVTIYVQGIVLNVHRMHPDGVKGFTELVDDVTELVAGARVERVVVFAGDDSAQVQLETCPFDCDRCHDNEICECGSCRKWRADYEDE